MLGSDPAAWPKMRMSLNKGMTLVTLPDGCGGRGWSPLLVVLPDNDAAGRFSTTLSSGGGAGWLCEGGAHVSKIWRSRLMRSAAIWFTRRDSEP